MAVTSAARKNVRRTGLLGWVHSVATTANVRVSVRAYAALALGAPLLVLLLRFMLPRGSDLDVLVFGAPPLEWTLAPGPDAVRDALASLSGADRQLYGVSLFGDMLRWLVFAAGGVLLLAHLLTQVLPARSGLHWLALLPLVAAVGDVVEDALLFAATRAYPNVPAGVAETAFVATALKLAFAALSVLVGATAAIVARARKDDAPTPARA